MTKTKKSLDTARENLTRLKQEANRLTEGIKKIDTAIMEQRSAKAKAIGTDNPKALQEAEQGIKELQSQRVEIIAQQNITANELTETKALLETLKERYREERLIPIQKTIDEHVKIYNEQAALLAQTLGKLTGCINDVRSLGFSYPAWKIYGPLDFPSLPRLYTNEKEVHSYNDPLRHHFISVSGFPGSPIIAKPQQKNPKKSKDIPLFTKNHKSILRD